MTGAVAPEHSRTRCRSAGQSSGSATSRYPRPALALALASAAANAVTDRAILTNAYLTLPTTVLPEFARQPPLIMRSALPGVSTMNQSDGHAAYDQEAGCVPDQTDNRVAVGPGRSVDSKRRPNPNCSVQARISTASLALAFSTRYEGSEP
jgi:hypothetical protein